MATCLYPHQNKDAKQTFCWLFSNALYIYISWFGVKEKVTHFPLATVFRSFTTAVKCEIEGKLGIWEYLGFVLCTCTCIYVQPETHSEWVSCSSDENGFVAANFLNICSIREGYGYKRIGSEYCTHTSHRPDMIWFLNHTLVVAEM